MAWLVLGAMVGAMALPVSAQGAYVVFPARASGASVVDQPTGKAGADAVVSLTVQDSTVQYAVTELTRQARMRPVFYGSAAVSRRISVHVVRMKLTDALGVVLRGTGLEAKLLSDGETVAIHPRAGGINATERAEGGTVIGWVTDSATGVGLHGAQVRVEGTKLSAVTADSGHFALRNVAPGDQVLQVRLFGYRPATRTVTVVDGERTTIRIAMTPVPTVLSGVVTTATGLQRKVEVGNDITSINVDSVMQVAPITSVTDLLETRVPGLTVLRSSGAPGDPSRIRLRGVGSVTGNNDPVIIVDGIRVYASQSETRNSSLAPSYYQEPDISKQGSVTNPGGTTDPKLIGYTAPSPLDQIDPYDIETIEVFKGPSASALYGSDAATGVIVITTKHGRAGPTHWSANLGQGVNWLPGNWPTNFYRFGTNILGNFLGPASQCLWDDLSCKTDSIVAFQALNNPHYTMLTHGSDQTADLTVSGGVQTLQYNLTGSVAGDVGDIKLPEVARQQYEAHYGPVPGWMLRPENYTTWGVSGQLTARPLPTAMVTVSSNLFDSRQQKSSLKNSIAALASEYIDSASLASNPLTTDEVERALDNQVSMTNALTITWSLGATQLSATGGINTINRTDETLIPYGICASGPGVLGNTSCGGDTTGFYGLGRGSSQDNTLTIGTTSPLLRQHVTLAVGANFHSGSTADVQAQTHQLAPGVTTPTSFPTTSVNGGSPSSFGQSTSAGSTYGWYVEPRLNLSSRFFVSPGFRLDGGSASGANAGLTGFPKVDLSYIAVDQNRPRGMLTLLRPRLAFGYAGTQPAPAEKLRLFNVGGLVPVVTFDGSTFVPLAQLSTLGNTQLRPERSSELEGGIDADLWNGRVSVTYTKYNKTRRDAIIPIPVASSVIGGTGTYQIYKNIGVVRNTGTELTVNTQLIQGRALSWTVGGNVSNDNNLVVRLNRGQSTVDLPDGTRVEAGFPLFGRFALPIVSYADLNHDGIVEPNELRVGDSAVYVGQQEPKYQLNVNTVVTMLDGRLSLTATFAYQTGVTQFNGGGVGALQLLPNLPGTSLATQAAVLATGGGSAGQVATNQQTDIGVIQTVNTFRFNDLSINYTLPKTIAALFRVPRMVLALQGSNLGLHTNYRGKDPDVNAFSTVSGGDITADLGQIPQPRTWWLKLSLGN